MEGNGGYKVGGVYYILYMRMNIWDVCISCASAWSVSLVRLHCVFVFHRTSQQTYLVHGGTA